MITAGKLLPPFNRPLRNVYRVNLFNPLNKKACDIASSTANIKNATRLAADKPY